MASLLTIPLELLVAVSAYLPTSDLGALRLTCKQTEKSLYEWFSKEASIHVHCSCFNNLL
jgi:hypothetical protein